MSTVLLLHAFPLNAAMWGPQVRALEASGHEVIAPDLPGFGAAPLAAEPTIARFAEGALAALDRHGASRAVVCGLSMGGYAALRLLAAAPARIAGLVLADTRADADAAEVRARRLAQIERCQREGSGWLAAELLPALLGPSAPAPVRTEAARLVQQARPEGVIAALRAMAERPDSTPLLPEIAVPAAVIVGADDGLTPPPLARAMAAAIPGAVLTEIAGAGHLSNLERPDAFNRALLAAVAAADSAA